MYTWTFDSKICFEGSNSIYYVIKISNIFFVEFSFRKFILRDAWLQEFFHGNPKDVKSGVGIYPHSTLPSKHSMILIVSKIRIWTLL